MSKAPLQRADTASRLTGGIARHLLRACAPLALLLAASLHAHAQQNGRGMTPPGLAPGAPAGSYSLSGFENVNLYNGNLNFNLPLLKVGGRGSVGASVNLAVNSVKWDMSFRPINSGTPTQPFRLRGYDETDYGAFDSLAQSTCNIIVGSPSTPPSVTCDVTGQQAEWRSPATPMHLPYSSGTTGYVFFPVARPDWAKWDALAPGYGPGVVRSARSSAWEQYIYPSPLDPRHNDPQYHKSQTLYRMVFAESDGTEHELVDTQTGGRPTFHSYAVDDDVERGRVFVSTDGSAMTFISDSVVKDNYGGEPTGYLFFADGTRCRVSAGFILWVRDADGNTVSYTYGGDASNLASLGRVTSIRDTLGRVVTITYGDMTNVWYDEIKFNGVGGELNRSMKVWRSRLADALRSDQSLKTIGELFPGTSRNVTYQAKQYNPVVTSAVELPDQRKYRMRYNSYGEMALVELPTGAAVKYNYADPVLSISGVMHRVRERLFSTDGVNWEERQVFDATYSVGQSSSVDGWVTAVTVETRDLKGGGDKLVSRERHYFHGHPMLATSPQLFYPSWKDGREYKVERLDTEGTGERVLLRLETEWRQRETPAWWQSLAHSTYQLIPANAPARDPRAVTATTAVEPYEGGANLLSLQTSVDPSDQTHNTVGFDQFNNRTDLWEFDFGSGGAAGPLLRRTHTDFVQTANVGANAYDYACASDASCGQSAAAANVIHIRNLPSATEVRDAAGSVVFRSEYVYDEPARVGDDYGSLPTDFPGWAAPAGPARGHPTTARTWLDTLGGYNNPLAYLETHAHYDRFGNTLKSWDARGAASEAKFSAEYKYALPTQTITADPDGAGPLTPLTTSTVYDFNSGVVTDTFDANGQRTRAEYESGGLDRLKKVTNPDGGWTEYDYGDGVGNLYLHTRTLRESLPAEKVLEAYRFFDGAGRALRSTSRTGDAAWAATATYYDGVGRAAATTNPYESADYAGAVPQGALWTTTEYDALGRTWKVTTPDGAKVVTHFDGQRTLVTDQSGRQRLSKTDALGRLTEVWEVRSADASTEPVTFPQYQDVPNVSAGYRTAYTYDVLGSLRKVEQGTQQRYFAYDSLKRLLRVRNPEQEPNAALQLPQGMVSPLSDNNNGWSVGYDYDANSNLKSRTDARGISTQHTYDALNRITLTDYSDSTPDVSFIFDGYEDAGGFHPIANARGRLTQVRSGVGGSVSTYSYTAFDIMGRVTASSQTTDGVTYSMPEYKYDLAGNLTSQTYPSGRVFETQYDAGGRVAGVKRGGGDYYAGGDPGAANDTNVIRYAPHGGVAALRLGNGLWERTEYNNRLQPERIRLGTEGAQGSVLQLDYGYGGANANNGNLLSQTITVPASETQAGLAATQVYTYDALNRLESARESAASGETWKQSYTYDRFGNRTLNASQTTLPKLTAPGQTAQPAVANPSVQTATNRITEDQDGDGAKEYTYDKAGNLTCDANHCAPSAASPHFEYDAENRLTEAGGGPSAGGSSYVYDGEGRRVKKVVGGAAVVFVYDALGRLVAEYGTQTQGAGRSYVTQDHLGSTRVVTGQQGEVKGRFDYTPFGEEVTAGRSNYGGGIRQKYTGKERDDEISLDFFGARYYSPTSGRFSSSDPADVTANQLVNPQRWNLYVFVINNPLTLYDPDGRQDKGKGGGKVIDVFVAITAKELKEARVSVAKRRLEKLGERYGYKVQVHSYDDSTVDNVKASLNNAVATFILGHAGKFTEDAEDADAKFISLKDGKLSTIGVLRPNPAGGVMIENDGKMPEAKGEVVSALGCNSGTLGPVVMPKNEDMSYIVLNGGSDRETSIHGAVLALNALVGGYITRGVDGGVAAGNAVLRQNGRTDHRDQGDSLERRGVRFDTIELKIPPETIPIP